VARARHFVLWDRPQLVERLDAMDAGTGIRGRETTSRPARLPGRALDEDDRTDGPVGVALGYRSVRMTQQGHTDKEAMSRTFDKIWNETHDGCQWLFWRCDFPMLAMTAARLGRTKEAVDALLFGSIPTTPSWPAVSNPAGSMPYLPQPAACSAATALMAAGWEGGPDKPAPGFPDDGSWVVKWEGLKKAL